MSTPQTYGTVEVIAVITEDRRRVAADQNAGFPQYVGYFDDWTLVEVTATIRTKLGVAFNPGDLVIARPASDLDADGFRTCYSPRNGIATSVPTEAVREVLVCRVDEQPVTA